MQINIKSKNLNLSDTQKDNLLEKVEKLRHLADRLDDESAEFRLEVEHEDSRKISDAYLAQLSLFVPGTVIRSEARAENIESAVDDCVAQIKPQIERYKAEIHRSEAKHPVSPKTLEPPVSPEEEFLET